MDNPYKECPVEKAFIEVCGFEGIKFTRPEKEKDNPCNLDFYLPDFQLYVEVKAFSCDRIHNQIKDFSPTMVLVGVDAVYSFGRMLKAKADLAQSLADALEHAKARLGESYGLEPHECVGGHFSIINAALANYRKRE